jgi:hypothetical protein
MRFSSTDVMWSLNGRKTVRIYGPPALLVSCISSLLVLRNAPEPLATQSYVTLVLVQEWFDFDERKDCREYSDWTVCAINIEKDLVALGEIVPFEIY